MDSLLVSLSGTLDRLTDFVQQQSPAVWAILMKQVYANAITSIVVGILFLLAIPLCKKGVVFCYKKGKDAGAYNGDGWWMGYGVCIGCMGIAILVGIGSIMAGVREFYNPAYYAIQFLLP